MVEDGDNAADGAEQGHANLKAQNHAAVKQLQQQYPRSAIEDKENREDSRGKECDVKRKSPAELQAESKFTQEYGKGFKMLQALGFKVGAGLGKDNNGIREPIRAVQKSNFCDGSDKKPKKRKDKSSYFENLAQKNNTKMNVKKVVRFEKKGVMVINGKKEEDDDVIIMDSPCDANNGTNDVNEEPIGVTQVNQQANLNQNTLIFNTYFHLNVQGNSQEGSPGAGYVNGPDGM